MKKNVIVYCHGLGSSPKSDKVDRLKELFPGDEVVAFQASVDPEIALKEVGDQVLETLMSVRNFNSEGELIFVGTSLGGWLADKLAVQFDAKAILMNPCYNPTESLKKYPELDESIVSKYTDIEFTNQDKRLLAYDPYDPVIDMSGLKNVPGAKSLFPNVGHRFNGPEFENTVQVFKTLFKV